MSEETLGGMAGVGRASQTDPQSIAYQPADLERRERENGQQLDLTEVKSQQTARVSLVYIVVAGYAA